MALATLTPSNEDIRKFGPLAYVSAAERSRIMALPSGQSQRAITALEREINTRRDVK